EQQKYAEAGEELRQAIQQNSRAAEAFFYLGMAELKSGHSAAAETSFRNALKLNPGSTNTAYNLGIVLLEEKKPMDAIPLLEQASRLELSNPALAVNLIRAYLEAGQLDRAHEAMQSADRRFRIEPEFNATLGPLLLSHGLIAEA